MLAPPTILARMRFPTAPRLNISPTRIGSTVAGNLAGFDRSRDIDSAGSNTCASPPIFATGSWRMIATHDPRPMVEIVPVVATA